MLLLGTSLGVAVAAEDELPIFLRNPALSPDGKMLAFDYDGDIWTVDAAGGAAKRLTSHPAMERRPYFSPDGKWILYLAAYYTGADLYIIPTEGGDPRRLTFTAGTDVPTGFSADGRYVYFYGFMDNIWDTFRVPFEGGTPVRMVAARRDYSGGATPSPDGKLLAFVYRAGYDEWSRAGFRSDATAEIYLAENSVPVTGITRLTNNKCNDFLPLWSPDGKKLYYVSDEDGTYNLYNMPLEWKGKQHNKLTKFEKTGIRWYTIAAQTGDMVIERNRRLYRLDPDNYEARLIEITIYDPPRYFPPEFAEQAISVTDFSVAPDGKKISFMSGNDVFVMSTDGGYAKQLTTSPEREENLYWSTDSNFILFNRIIGGGEQIVRVDVRDSKEEVLTSGHDNKFSPYSSADGKSILYELNYDEIRAMDLDGKNDRLLVKGTFARRVFSDGRWFDLTPDGKWLLYFEQNPAMRYDAKVKRIGDDSPPVIVSPLGGGSFPGMFSSDYKYFTFTNYESDKGTIFVLDFEKDKTPRESPIQKLDDLLNPPPKPEKPAEGTEPVNKGEDAPPNPGAGDKLDFSDLINRIRPAAPTFPGGNSGGYIMKNNRTLLFLGDSEGGNNLFAVPLAEAQSAQFQQVTNFPGNKVGFELDKAEQNAYFIMNGAIFKVPMNSRQPAKISPASVRKPYNDKSTRRAVFEELHWMLDHGFYDPQHHGLDLDKLREKYLPLVDRCVDDGTFAYLMDEYIGEYNASHMGFYSRRSTAPDYSTTEKNPHPGFFYDDAMIEQGFLVIKHLVQGTPACRPNSGLKEGDYVLEIAGTKYDRTVDLFNIIRNTLGQEVKFVVADNPAGDNKRTVYLPMIDINAMYGARLNEWEETNRKYVEEKSNGKFGYICLRTMMGPDLEKYRRFIGRYVGNFDGVVLDFRYNGGGYISNDIVASLADTPWLFRRSRGSVWSPEDVVRDFSFQKAVVGMFNYGSFSNAEMMCAGMNIKHIGKTVGTPTAGGVIGTVDLQLLDGSVARLPTSAVFDLTGRNLEGNPTEPEIYVDQDVKDEMEGRFPQLDVAVDTLRKLAKDNAEKLLPKNAR